MRGKGGSYEKLPSGKVKLVHRTKTVKEAKAEQPESADKALSVDTSSADKKPESDNAKKGGK